MDKYALIVIYNKSCEDSLTIRSLLQNISTNDLYIIVFDNSIRDFGNAEFCHRHNIMYFSLGRNVGLPKAYNYVIDQISHRKGYMVILDDDTELSKHYCDEIVKIDDDMTDVYLPIVKVNDYILSPSNVIFRSGSHAVKSIREIKPNRITAINSGMVVKLDIYKMIRYEEKLFLDLSDHEFMRRVREFGLSIKLLQSEIKQTYSRKEKSDLETALYRYRIYKKDVITYGKLSKGLLFCYFALAKVTISNILYYKSLRFLFLYR